MFLYVLIIMTCSTSHCLETVLGIYGMNIYVCMYVCMHQRLAIGKYKWFLFLVSSLYTDKLVWKFYWLSITDIKDNIYWHCTCKMPGSLNTFLHKFLSPTPDIILIILCCNVHTWHMLVDFPQKIIPYSVTEWKYAKYQNLHYLGLP
jgi:hypothetical protein